MALNHLFGLNHFKNINNVSNDNVTPKKGQHKPWSIITNWALLTYKALAVLLLFNKKKEFTLRSDVIKM